MLKAIIIFILLCCSIHAQDLQIFTKNQYVKVDLLGGPTYLWNRFHSLTTTFEVTKTSHLTLGGHINLVHRNLVVGPVGFAIRAYLIGPYASESDVNAVPYPGPVSNVPFTVIHGSTISGNITNIEEHYKEVPLYGYKVIDPGWYRVEIWGNSHSSASSYSGLLSTYPANGLPYNELLVRIETR